MLVCEHRGHAEAGVQVIAGTVEPGESVEAALWREIEEETGLGRGRLRLERTLGESDGEEPDEHWHGFELAPLFDLPERWSHTVGGEGEDKGMVFDYYWLKFSAHPNLAGDHDIFLPILSSA